MRKDELAQHLLPEIKRLSTIIHIDLERKKVSYGVPQRANRGRERLYWINGAWAIVQWLLDGGESPTSKFLKTHLADIEALIEKRGHQATEAMEHGKQLSDVLRQLREEINAGGGDQQDLEPTPTVGEEAPR